MLVCPVAAGVLDRIGVAGWSVGLGIAAAGPGSALRAEDPLGISESAASQWRSLPEELGSPEFGGARAERSALAPGSELADAAAPEAGESAPPPAPASSDHDRAVPSTVPAFAFQRIAPLAGLVWLLASAVLLARLAGAWRQLARLRRSAAQADAATIRTCREVAALLQVAAPEVKHTPYLSSPCLVSLRRPVVLEMAAEEVCDDYVLQHGSDRQAYAHRLVDIARLSCAPLAAGGVGVVSRRSMLARRVVRILDTSRSVSTNASSPLLILVLLAGLLSTAGTALPRRGVASAGRRDGPPAAAEGPPRRAAHLRYRLRPASGHG